MTTSPSLTAFKCNVDTVIGNQDFISASKNPAKKLQIIEALDQRAYSLCLQGKFEAATSDAQSIITSSEYSTRGYLRLGNIYEAQGRQQHAIKIYEQGLRCVPSTNPSYTLLVEARSKAIERNSKRVDFIAELPFELIEIILIGLPKTSKVACLQVSNAWRSKILNCELVWSVMTAEDTIQDNCLAAVLPKTAAHVEYLTIDTTNFQIWDAYMHHLQNGSFSKIKALHWKGDALYSVPSALIYSHIKNTLTKLDLFDIHMPIGLTIADILYTCSNLTRLGFKELNNLQDAIGDFTILEMRQHPLRDLQLECYYTTTHSLEPLLQRCPQLQRLVLNKCSESVLDIVYKTCQSLRIFAFDPNFKVTALEDLYVPDERPGMLEFYTTSGSYGASPHGVLPLIRKNMDTLRVIVANISLTLAQNLGNAPYFSASDRSYDNLRFPNIQRLSYWSDPTTLFEPILLRSISACTSLRALTVVQVKIMDKVIDTLLALPPLEELDMSFTWEEETITEGLIRLFRYYAQHSRTHNVCLSHCRSVTDMMLEALGDMKSLRTLALWNLYAVSAEGLDRFLKQISGIVTSLNLSEMKVVKDSHLNTIGILQGLTKLKLQQIQGITNTGIIAVIDSSESLEHMVIAECYSLTEVVYTIARNRLQKFELNYAIDYD